MKIACLGDSITAGIAGGVIIPYPQRLETWLGPEHTVGNYGVGNYTVAQIASRWTSAARGRGHTHLVLLGGVNDIRVGTSASVVIAAWDGIVDQAVADGLVVVASTILPWKNAFGQWTAARQTETDALNASIRAKLSAVGGRLVDGYALLGGADPTALADAYDGGDDIHPNQVGTDLIASAVLAQLP